MKVGSLVRHIFPSHLTASGIVTGFDKGFAIVFWSIGLSHEREYPEQLEVINEDRWQLEVTNEDR